MPRGSGGPLLVAPLFDPNILMEDLLDDRRPMAGEKERGVVFVCCPEWVPSPPLVGVLSLFSTLPNKFDDFPTEVGVEGSSFWGELLDMIGALLIERCRGNGARSGTSEVYRIRGLVERRRVYRSVSSGCR